jgi:hypothetical protein
MLETLEPRMVPAGITAELSGKVFTVTGTPEANVITVKQADGLLTVDGVDGTFAALQVARVVVLGLDGDDIIDVSTVGRKTSLYGGAGHDTITGGLNIDLLDGGDGDDALTDLNGPGNTLLGGIGNDTLTAGAGNDLLDGQVGDDVLDGGAGNDRLYGHSGVDQLFGGMGNDWLEAGTAAEKAVSGWNAYGWAMDGTTPDDIAQGYAGTCSFLAGMAAATNQGMDLSQRITYLGNFHYQVSLFDRHSGWTTRNVVFNGKMVRDGSGRIVDPRVENEGEFWTVLMQRAYLKLMGFNPMRGSVVANNFPGDLIERALTTVTGKSAWLGYTGLTTPDTLAGMLARGDAMTAGSRLSSAGLVVGNHAYMVDAVFQEGGEWKVRLYNPWGFDGYVTQGDDDGLITITWSAFRRTYDNVASAEV